MKKINNKPMSTAYIKDFIAAYFEKPKDNERGSDVLIYLMYLIGDGKTAPMPLMNLTLCALDLNPDTESEDIFGDGPDPEELFCFVESEDGRKWFPLYSDVSEIGEAVNTNVVREVSVRSIVEAALDTETIDGIMINPDSDSFAVSKIVFERMLEKAEGFKGMEEAGVVMNPATSKKNKRRK